MCCWCVSLGLGLRLGLGLGCYGLLLLAALSRTDWKHGIWYDWSACGSERVGSEPPY